MMLAASAAGGAHDEIDETHGRLHPGFLMQPCISRAENL